MSGKQPYPTAPMAPSAPPAPGGYQPPPGPAGYQPPPGPAGYQPPPQGYPQHPYPSSNYPYQQSQAAGSSPYGAAGGPPPYARGQPQGAPPPYSQYPPAQYPQGPPQQVYYPQQPQTVVAQGAFDSGARFDGASQPRIPPPPPGVTPNAAQMAAMQGHTVVGTQQKADWFSGGKGGGFTFW